MTMTQKWARGYMGSWLKLDAVNQARMVRNAYQAGTPECMEFLRLVAAHTAPVKPVVFA